MNMNQNEQKQTKWTGDNEDEQGTNMDLARKDGHINGNDEEPIAEQTTKQPENANSTGNESDPFKPRKSMCRSPIGECTMKTVTDSTVTPQKQKEHQEIIIMGDDEDDIFLQTRTEDTSERGKTATNLKTGDNIIIRGDQIVKMIKQICEARNATKAIYEYAMSTKNVKGLLKEKSKWALRQLENLDKELESISRNKVEQETTPGKDARDSKKPESSKKDMATQTTREDRPNLGHKPRVNENNAENRTAKRKVVSPLQNAEKIYKRTEKHDTGNKTNPVTNNTRNQVGGKNHDEPTERAATTSREPAADDMAWVTISRKKTVEQNQMNNQHRKQINERTGKPTNLINNKQRGEALSITMEGNLSFAEVVSKLKEKTGPEPQGIKGLRRTLNGNLLVEFSKGTDSTELYNKLTSKMVEGCTIRRMIPKMDIEILDIDPTVEAEELKEALQKNMNVNMSDIRIKMFRNTTVGLKRAIAEIPAKGTTSLEGKVKIKIGWTLCRIRVITKVIRCFKCHEIGHMAISCPMKGEEKTICRRCGEEGHSIAECKGAPKCILCSRRGSKVDIGHVAGSFKCPVYGEAVKIKEARNKIGNG